MNALIVDLQSAAWDRDVKIVLDASSGFTARFQPEPLQQGLSNLLGLLIKSVPPTSTIAVVTAFESAESGHETDPCTGYPTEAAGVVKIEVTAPADGLQTLSENHEELRAFFAAVEKSDGVATVDWSTKNVTFSGRFHGSRASTGSGGRTALVVDDDVDMQDFLGAALKRQGFDVIAVNDGFDALIVIERNPPDVVLTDVMMPNMNGLDLITRIKNVRGDLPVIVFSGYHETLADRIGTGVRHQADFVLPKPMSQRELIEALAAVLPTH